MQLGAHTRVCRVTPASDAQAPAADAQAAAAAATITEPYMPRAHINVRSLCRRLPGFGYERDDRATLSQRTGITSEFVRDYTQVI